MRIGNFAICFTAFALGFRDGFFVTGAFNWFYARGSG